MLHMLKNDLQIELGISEGDARIISTILSAYSINDALRKINNILCNYGVIAKKVAVGSNRRLFFYDPSKYNLAADHRNLFYLGYENSNSRIDLNNYSSIKNWDTYNNVEGYCTILN